MTEARFTLTISSLTHDGATAMASAIEDDMRLDPLAVIINETDEALKLWEVALYFATLEKAREAAAEMAVSDPQVASLPDRDWVRQSLEGLAPVVAGRFFLFGSHDRHRRRGTGLVGR